MPFPIFPFYVKHFSRVVFGNLRDRIEYEFRREWQKPLFEI